MRVFLKVVRAQYGLVVMVLMAATVGCGVHPGEASTAANQVRVLVTAEIQYQAGYGKYAPDIQALGGAELCQEPTSAHACLIDGTLADSSSAHPKYDYYYMVRPGPNADAFVVWGIPVDSDSQAFCAIDDGVVRASDSGVDASSTSYAACKSLTPIDD